MAVSDISSKLEYDFEPESDFKLKGGENFNGTLMQNKESIFDKSYKSEEDVNDGMKLQNSMSSDKSNCVDGASPLQPEKVIDVLDVECKTSENLSTVENIDEETGKPTSHMLAYCINHCFQSFQ